MPHPLTTRIPIVATSTIARLHVQTTQTCTAGSRTFPCAVSSGAPRLCCLSYVLAAPDDPKTTPLIRDCTTGGGGNEPEPMIADVLPDNQKKAGDPFRASLESAPARVDGAENSRDMRPTTRGSEKRLTGDVVALFKGMRSYFAARNNCDEKLFARHQDLAVGGQRRLSTWR